MAISEHKAIDNDAPRMTALAPWFGSKRVLIGPIIQELGEHEKYFEPFCGGVSVIISKPCCKHEVINDLNSDIVNLAYILSMPDLGSKLFRRLRRYIICEELYDEANARLKDLGGVETALQFRDGNGVIKPDLDRAFWFFIRCWTGRGGFAGTERSGGFARKWRCAGGAEQFTAAVDSIPAFMRRLRGVNVYRMDAFKMIEKIADIHGTAIYCDPPYIAKGGKYIYDFSISQHYKLRDLLNRFKRARVVVSYYDDPEISKMYSSWTKRLCEINKNISQSNEQEAKIAPEILLINGKSYAPDNLQGRMFE